MGLIHSDIKLENILYKDVNDEEIQVKIGDMGGTCTLLFNELKKQSTDKDCKNCKICLNRFRGTLPYLDPKLYEKFLENVYSGNFTKENLWIKNTDWYGFAITLINFLVGKNIISNRELQRIMQYAAKKEDTLENLIEMYRAYISSEIKFAIDDHKDKWLKFGLRPDILKFIEVNTINYI
jgi:serine/threonine protein kinase